MKGVRMKAKKMWAVFMAAALSAVCLSGCGNSGGGNGSVQEDSSSENREDGNSASGDVRKVGFVLNTLENEFYTMMRDGAQEVADSSDSVEIIVQAPEAFGDVDQEVQIVENLIAMGIDALVISPADSTSFLSVFKELNAQDIPIILVNNGIDDAEAEKQGVYYAAYVGTDNYMGGQQAAECVKENYPDGAQIAILTGIPGVQAGDERVRGFEEAFDGDGRYEIVAKQTANWTRDEGFNVAQNMLTANPDIDVFFGASDLMALGAMEAVDQMGLTGDVGIIGFDYTNEAAQAVEEGRMLGSVDQKPVEMAQLSIQAAIDILDGKEVEEWIATDIGMGGE